MDKNIKNKWTENIDDTNKELNITNNFEDSENTILFITGGAGFIGSNFINNIWDNYKKIKIINFDALY